MYYPLMTIGWERLNGITANADATLFRLINGGLHARALDWFMIAATTYGTGVAQVGISLCFIVLGLLLDKTNLRRAGYAGLIALTISLVAVAVAKDIWNRPRPLLQLFDVHIVSERLFTQSFPSGHSSTALAVAFAYSAFLPKLRWVLIALGVTVMISRVYLGVHFPLDTIYGGLMGAAIGMAGAKIVRRFQGAECSEVNAARKCATDNL